MAPHHRIPLSPVRPLRLLLAVAAAALLALACAGRAGADTGCTGTNSLSPPWNPSRVMPSAFKSSFEGGTFAEWGGYGAQSQPEYYPPASIVDPLTEGLPRLDGCRAARFEVTLADAEVGRTHAKIITSWYQRDSSGAKHPPADVSGTYSAWYYLPTSYHVQDTGWVNIMQWKEPYSCSGYCSDPSWWITLNPAQSSDHASRPDAPVAMLEHWRGGVYHHSQRRVFPLGRWVQVRADFYQGDRIVFYIDGQYFDTATQAEYPIGPMHGDRSLEWGFGVGNYSGRGSGAPENAVNGPMYIDDVTYRSFASGGPDPVQPGGDQTQTGSDTPQPTPSQPGTSPRHHGHKPRSHKSRKSRRLHILSRHARVSKSGRIKLRLACPRIRRSACRGTVAVTARSSANSARVLIRSRHRYSIRAGHRRQVTLRLSRHALRRLTRCHRSHVEATAVVSREAGSRPTARRALDLRLSRPVGCSRAAWRA